MHFPLLPLFQIWAYHVTNVEKLSKNFMSSDTLQNFRKKSANMRSISALVQELLKFFVRGHKAPQYE